MKTLILRGGTRRTSPNTSFSWSHPTRLRASRFAASVVALALVLGSSAALAQTVPAAPPPPPAVAAPAPPDTVAPQGEWVETAEYGWVWVPASSDTVTIQEQPYTYLYTPSYGWTWYVSPWGFGRYHPGPWVRPTVYAPRVWRTNVWVAPEHRVVVRPRYAPPARVVYRAPPARPVVVVHPAHRR